VLAIRWEHCGIPYLLPANGSLGVVSGPKSPSMEPIGDVVWSPSQPPSLTSQACVDYFRVAVLGQAGLRSANVRYSADEHAKTCGPDIDQRADDTGQPDQRADDCMPLQCRGACRRRGAP
jgi:hypothetical protein